MTSPKQQQHQQQHPLLVFQRFEYHLSMEHDEKHPQPKFGENRFMGAQDMVA